MLYLSTRGQEGFYDKLGYEVCKPILYYGVALEPSSDGEIKVNGDLPKNKVLAVIGAPPNNGDSVHNGVKNDVSVQNGVEIGESVRNVVKNGNSIPNSVRNDNFVENGVPSCNTPVICPLTPPPPPPPFPTNNVKSHTIFRDIKSSKTYMGKSVKTSSYVNFLSKES